MIADFVTAYQQAGWATIRIGPRAKRPMNLSTPWRARVDAPETFHPDENVGVRLGQPSGGLCDIDLDCPEAVALAPLFLHSTATFGRGGERRHWLYITATKTRKPPRIPVELRSTGCQTVFPGSTHETGQPIVWIDAISPRSLSETDLLATFGKLCAATLIATEWPNVQARHDAHHVILALAGCLWYAGWEQQDAVALLLPAIELHGGVDSGHRAQAIADTWDDEHDRGRWGWPKLGELLGPPDAKAFERAIELVGETPRSQLQTDEFGPLTDLGNAERFLAEYGDDVCAVPGLGWMQWDGTRWELGHEPTAMIARSVRALGRRATDLNDGPAMKWAIGSESAQRLGAIENLARKLDRRVRSTDLDTSSWALNTPSGTVDLQTATIHPHDRSGYHTKITGVSVDLECRCPRFIQFLQEVFVEKDLIEYMLRFLGYCLTGEHTEQMFQLWHGDGSNGKSTLVELLLFVLGDYGQKMASGLLLQQHSRSSAAASPDIARIRGVRFTAGTETSEAQRYDESLVKELTGGETIVARHLHQEPFEINPTWKLVLAVNHKPIVRGTDFGIWRRIHLVPFLQQFDGPRKDPALLDKLQREGPGILGLLVHSCLMWRREGLQPPSVVQAAVEAYRQEHDVIGGFLEECLLDDPQGRIQRTELYRVYRQWAVNAGLTPLGRQTIFRIFRERGLQEIERERVWIGKKVKGAML